MVVDAALGVVWVRLVGAALGVVGLGGRRLGGLLEVVCGCVYEWGSGGREGVGVAVGEGWRDGELAGSLGSACVVRL